MRKIDEMTSSVSDMITGAGCEVLLIVRDTTSGEISVSMRAMSDSAIVEKHAEIEAFVRNIWPDADLQLAPPPDRSKVS